MLALVDHLQAKNDYEVNLKAELEIMQLHDKFNELRDSSWVDLVRMQQQQIEMLERLVSENSGRRTIIATDVSQPDHASL